jgi:hypothetical protein
MRVWLIYVSVHLRSRKETEANVLYKRKDNRSKSVLNMRCLSRNKSSTAIFLPKSGVLLSRTREVNLVKILHDPSSKEACTLGRLQRGRNLVSHKLSQVTGHNSERRRVEGKAQISRGSRAEVVRLGLGLKQPPAGQKPDDCLLERRSGATPFCISVTVRSKI